MIAATVLLIGTTIARAEMSSSAREDTLRVALAAFDRATDVAAQSPDEAVHAYRDAARGFEALLADGVTNGKLYYNLGNTYLQLGDLGKAILNYRRAEEFIGHDPQLQANLRYARSIRRNRIEASGEKQLLHTVFFWHYDTSIRARYVVGVVAYLAFWGVLIARTFRRRAAAWGYVAAALLVLWLAAGTSVAVEAARDRAVREGVTVQNDIVVRKGNGESYEPAFKESLYEGVEFTIVEERPGWFKIELPDRNGGWIRSDQIDII